MVLGEVRCDREIRARDDVYSAKFSRESPDYVKNLRFTETVFIQWSIIILLGIP